MLDLEDYRLDISSLPKPVVGKRRQRLGSVAPAKSSHRLGYLGGPVPGEWLSIAGNLPGKSLHVGLSLWLASGVERKKRFKFPRRWYAWFNLSPVTVSRSLHRLRDAGLIRLEYRPGCSPIVTLLTDHPESSKKESQT